MLLAARGDWAAPRGMTWPSAIRPASTASAAATDSPLRSTAALSGAGSTADSACSSRSAGVPWASFANCAISSGWNRRHRRPGCGLTTCPPPIVMLGDGRRTMKRSPAARATGAARRSCAQPVPPGRICSASSRRTRAADLGRAAEEVHHLVVAQRGHRLAPFDVIGHKPQTHVHEEGGLQHAGSRDHHAARQLIGMEARQVDREAAARQAHLHRPLMGL